MIKILDESVINKIAAGEVIERPASIVKELLENAIDAQASQITIHLEQAGRQCIRVTDNGSGMNKEDVTRCVQKHATSKITSAEDLFNITTLGFRGEALASIAAISNLTITSKQEEGIEAHQIRIEGGAVRSQGSVAGTKGTTVEVKDIFFNTPARMKFLKQDAVELKKITDIITRYALLYHNIGLKLTHEKTIFVQTSPAQDKIHTISRIYGIEIAKHLLPIEYKDKRIVIKGYISKPSCTRNDNHHQSFYVNKRYIRSNLISQAITNAYHSLLFTGKFPIIILDIETDAKTIDVNVHPTKEQIKIEQEQEFQESVQTAIRTTLQENNLIKEIELPLRETQVAIARNIAPQYLQTTSVQTAFSNQTMSTNPGYLNLEKLPGMRILGQIHKTYFLAEYNEGLLIIDQHVVQERINYEKFMQELCTSNLKIQTLLQPEIIHTTPEETILLQRFIEQLHALGYTIEPFGQNEFVLRTVPTVFGKVQAKEIITYVAQALEENKITALHEIMEEILTSKSCRSSIMAGDIVSIPEMISYLSELDKCNLPFTCPHGRPVFINLTKLELEKFFKRK